MKSAFTLKVHSGSAVAISLLYITVMLVMILGVTSLLAKIIKSNGYITQSIQASYNSESALELALYELRMRREGYERTQDPKSIPFLDNPTPKNNTYFYSIEYKGKETTNSKIKYPQQESLLIGKKQIALYYDQRTSSGGSEIISIDDTTPVIISTHDSSNSSGDPCVIIKISGQRVDNAIFEAVSTTLECNTSQPLLSLSGKDTTDITQDNSRILPFMTFLKEHKEIIMEVKSIYKRTPGIEFTISSPQRDISTLYKTVYAGGRFNDLEVRRKILLEQDQTPEILSSVILHD